jgi:STE24 endopeptidase
LKESKKKKREEKMIFESVIGFIVSISALEFYIRYRQHCRFHEKKLPAALNGLVSDEKFTKSQAYNLAKSTFAFVLGSFDLLIGLAILLFGAMPSLWQLSGVFLQRVGVDASSDVMRAMVFLVIMEGTQMVFHIPFNLYSTFVIEERFGFNKQSLRLWCVDLVKVIVLQIALGLPALAGLLLVIDWAGEHLWFWAWLFTFVLVLFFITIFPSIQALFNKFEEVPDGELRQKIEALAKRVNFPLTKLYSMDASARTAHGNAYFYGFFKNKRIVIYDTLLKQTSIDGTVAIVGHELGHFQHQHVLKNMIVTQVYLLVFFYLFGLSLNWVPLFEAFGFRGERPVFIGLLLFSQVYQPLSQAFGLLMHIVSRRFEYQADEFALDLGLQLEGPLTKIYEENLSNMVPDSWYSTYHNSHPTLVERLDAMSRHRSKGKKKN